MTQAVLITGASSGIGATYADRFARRGHDLVLVARDTARLDALAARLRAETGVAVETLTADLTQAADLARVETRLREDASIGVLVNNAGAALKGAFQTQTTEAVANLLALNTTAVLRLASAVAPRLAAQGSGAIINIGSVVGLAPEFGQTVYGATKAFVHFLSQGLAVELGPQGVRVQAVLPGPGRSADGGGSTRRRAGVSTRVLTPGAGCQSGNARTFSTNRRAGNWTPWPYPDAAGWG